MKIPVGILGATGSVGQKFIQLLANHPWFEIQSLAASERSAGKRYGECVNWFMSTPLPSAEAEMMVQLCKPDLPCKIVFSGLDASVAGKIEEDFAKAGYSVISNSRNHRFDDDVPLLIPEINPDHLAILARQTYAGQIVTNPNCSTIGLAMALKPLQDKFGIEAVYAVTLQALSGAGYPGVSSLDIIDNVVPFIGGEEEKMETEPLKILGKIQGDRFQNADFRISAQCNRVAVIDGHLESVAVKLKNKPGKDEMIEAWQNFKGVPQELSLPMAPARPIYYYHEKNYPQPKLHRDRDKGMALHIGRLRDCPIFDYKFTILSHNTVRGAAGGALLNAELMYKKGLLPI